VPDSLLLNTAEKAISSPLDRLKQLSYVDWTGLIQEKRRQWVRTEGRTEQEGRERGGTQRRG